MARTGRRSTPSAASRTPSSSVPASGKLLGTRWICSNHSYKSGGALEAHFGLGQQTAADLKVTLPSGKAVSFARAKADQFLDLNLTTSLSTPVPKEAKP